MTRRRLSPMFFALTLLTGVAVQLLGPIAFASACLEPCPDDTDSSSCPPVCSFCASCSHARQAMLQSAGSGVTFVRTADAFTQRVAVPSPAFAADIFHVPLRG